MDLSNLNVYNSLGFISFESPEVDLPGNSGLKDQNLAIRWVVENIANFGGDPKNITLFGESAGGCAVHYHMISELSKGLFQRAIVMSGCALNNWSTVPKRNFGERLAKALGWNGQGGEKVALEVLMNATPEDIVAKQNALLTENVRSVAIEGLFFNDLLNTSFSGARESYHVRIWTRYRAIYQKELYYLKRTTGDVPRSVE